MWMRTIICSLTVLTLYQGVSGIWFRTSYDSPEERALYPVLQGLSRHIDDIAEILQWMSPEFESVMADLAESRDLTNTSSQNCQDCVVRWHQPIYALTFQDAVKILIKLN